MKHWPYKTPGLPDEIFDRGEVPMTKEEVRAVTLSKARLKEDSIIYDIGAGTGSISIEAAIQSTGGKVYAIERNLAGIALIQQNISAFNINNIEVITGKAPEVIEGLPAPDRVIIGGSGGNLKDIILCIDQKINPGGRIVVNAVVLETLFQAIKTFEELGYEIDIAQVAITRGKKIKDLHMLQALNPVYIVTAERSQA